jgi:hypothetical protein
VRISTPKFDTQREWAKNGQFTTKLHLLSVLMRLCAAHGSTRLNAYSVDVVGAGSDEGTEFVPLDGLARPEAEMPGQPVDFGHVDA